MDLNLGTTGVPDALHDGNKEIFIFSLLDEVRVLLFRSFCSISVACLQSIQISSERRTSGQLRYHKNRIPMFMFGAHHF